MSKKAGAKDNYRVVVEPRSMTQDQAKASLTVDDILSIGRRAMDKCHGTEAQHIYIAREVERLFQAAPAAVPAGWKLAQVSDGDIRVYGPDKESWLIRKDVGEGFYDFVWRFFAAMLAAAPQAQPARAVLTDAAIHDLASYWVYIRPSRESEQYEELRQFARAVEATIQGRDALELDTHECEDCAGKGWNWESHQVAERETDVQEFKIECKTCAGRGYVGPDADRRAGLISSPQPEAHPAQPQEVPREWRSTLRKLAFMARTSGGAAGPDSGLMAALSGAEALLSQPYLLPAAPSAQAEQGGE